MPPTLALYHTHSHAPTLKFSLSFCLDLSQTSLHKAYTPCPTPLFPCATCRTTCSYPNLSSPLHTTVVIPTYPTTSCPPIVQHLPTLLVPFLLFRIIFSLLKCACCRPGGKNAVMSRGSHLAGDEQAGSYVDQALARPLKPLPCPCRRGRPWGPWPWAPLAPQHQVPCASQPLCPPQQAAGQQPCRRPRPASARRRPRQRHWSRLPAPPGRRHRRPPPSAAAGPGRGLRPSPCLQGMAASNHVWGSQPSGQGSRKHMSSTQALHGRRAGRQAAGCHNSRSPITHRRQSPAAQAGG